MVWNVMNLSKYVHLCFMTNFSKSKHILNFLNQ